jgi:aminoglycoside phosphotransferase (APT) family kinase protein
MLDEIAPGSRPGRVRRLKGGISMGMHAVEAVVPDGPSQFVVLRRYNPLWKNHDAAACRREFQTLGLLSQLGIPAPRPVWLDEHGRLFGTPSMAMSLLPGTAALDSGGRASWLRELATALARLHAAPLHAVDVSFLDDQNELIDRHIRRGPRPRDMRLFPECAGLWDRLEDLWPRRVPVPRSVVHRDYWAGNTLWRRGRITGIVDWEDPALGDPGEDVGYCRMDLATFLGGNAPADFLRYYEAAAGRKVANLEIWDLVGATRPLPDPAIWLPGYDEVGRGRLGVTPRVIRARLRRWIRGVIESSGPASARALAP